MTTESPATTDFRTLLRRPARGRGWLAAALLYSVCFLLGAGYHVVSWSSGAVPSTGLQIVYTALIAVGYTALWFTVSGIMRRRRTSPARTLWTILAVGVIVILLGAVVSRVGRPALPDSVPFEARLGFDINTGVPLVLATVVKMNLISLGQILFAFVLLIKLRDLVLVKRSRSSQRNWAIMIGMMIVVSALTVMKPADSDLNEWQKIAMIVAVVFMIVNAFRLSWIVFLPFKEKMATIGLCFTLILALTFGLGILSDGPSRLLVPGAYNYLEHYSYALAVFTSQAAIFGILYCSTAFLSLIFHLPTSGEYEQRAGERATMSSLAHLVGQVFDVDSLYATIAAAPVEAGSADSSWLAVFDPSSGSLTPTVVATHRADPEKISRCVDMAAIMSELDRTGEALVIDEGPGDHRIDARPGDGLDSLLVVPLIARNDTLGALFAAKEVIRGFERDDVQTVGIFAAQAAVALDNARLFEQKVEKERLSRELSIAREVQRRLLPQHVPQAAGLSMAASSVSAQEVGGDYYDFVKLDEGRLGIIVADVSGKGTSAAFYMAEMQGIFRSVSRLARTPIEFLGHANAALADSLDRNVFISAIYGILDTDREEIRIARAGHCPVAMISIEGDPRYLRTRGLGLGLDRGRIFDQSLIEEVITLQPGDVFVLYTDGVVESRNASNDEYGYERLLESLREHRHESADELHASILSDLRRFLGHEDYDDDLTLLVIKWHGLPADAVKEPQKILEESA